MNIAITVLILIAAVGGFLFIFLRKSKTLALYMHKQFYALVAARNYFFLARNVTVQRLVEARVTKRETVTFGHSRKAVIHYSFKAWDNKDYTGMVVAGPKYWHLLKNNTLPVMYSTDNPRINVLNDVKFNSSNLKTATVGLVLVPAGIAFGVYMKAYHPNIESDAVISAIPNPARLFSIHR